MLLLILAAVLVAVPAARPAFAEDHDEDHEYFEGPFGEIEMLRQALAVMLEFAEINRDPQAVAVIAVSTIQDYVEDPEQAVEMLEDLLPDVEDPVVQRAVRFKLAELYAAMGEQDEALKHLRALIINRPQADE
jgi:tetratricopeptide (TPR) repeat protein